MSTIRLTVNDELEEVLKFLEDRYKPLTRAEILKLGLAEIYRKSIEDLPVEKLNKEQEVSLKEALKDYEKGNYKKFDNVDDLMKDLEN